MAAQRKSKPKRKQSHKEKKETLRPVFVVPEEITSKRGLMLWLLETLGKQWTRISCAKALLKLNIEDNKKNRKQWYNTKSEFKESHKKNEGDSKYQKPRVTFHNFNQASLYLSSAYTLRVRGQALSKGWQPTKAKNRFIIWRSDSGWIKWFETGRCLLHCRKPVTDGKVMQLLANAYFNTELLKDIKEFTVFYRSFFTKSVKITAHLGKAAKIPRFQLAFDNGSAKLIVMNDESHPHGIEIQYYLTKDGEQVRQYLMDSQRTLDFTSETILLFQEFLKGLMTPKALRKDVDRMVI